MSKEQIYISSKSAQIRAETEGCAGRWVNEDLAKFADNLVVARSMLKEYPELVNAPLIPEYLRVAYVLEWDDDPGAEGNSHEVGTPEVSAETKAEYQKKALKFASLLEARKALIETRKEARKDSMKEELVKWLQ